MNICNIGGIEYNVLVVAIEENFNILYSENTGRTLAIGAPMALDPYGTFFGHKITLRRQNGHETEYDQLWDYISTPRYNGIPVKLAHNQTTLSYTAYISNGTRYVERIDEKENKIYWGEMVLNIIPIRAQVTP